MSSDTDGNGDAHEDLLREVEALRAENARLRGLLGLDDRSDDGHVQAWAPTLLAEPTEQSTVDASSPAADKLALLWSLFGARSDVYARRWESASSGKTGWSPATMDRWSKGRPPKSYLPLTDEVFLSHLRGDETIGIYHALPLQGGSAARGTTLFLDPTKMQPWPDQWAFLSSVARMKPDAVESLAETLRPVDTGPTLSPADLARAGGPPPPPLVRARLGAELSIERAGMPPAVIAGLKHLGSIANPEFYEKQRMRFSTWDTPRFISAYHEDLEWLHLPRGLTGKVEDLFASLGSTLEITDDRPEPPAANF